jgi:hypothetical protein
LLHNEELQPLRKFAPHQERRGKNGMRNEEEEPPFILNSCLLQPSLDRAHLHWRENKIKLGD